MRLVSSWRARTPGLAVAAAVAGLSWLLARAEGRWLGNAVVDALVIAILLGILVREWLPRIESFEPGIEFAAKDVLEFAVFLLGASVDLPLLLSAGPALAVGIITLVVAGLAGSYAIGRALGLESRLAVLVAAGNAICGNSAIAAVAPVIGAKRDQVAAAIAFTAILGVLVVLTLPLLAPLIGLSHYQYGVLAGLTVYAVPQVLAAAFPVSAISGQVATLVKLVRVLMLGPVVLFFTLRERRKPEHADAPALELGRLVPWFIVGFLALAALRSVGVIPSPLASALKDISHWFTLLAMAGLGLGVEFASIRRAGPRVVATVILSLLLLVAIALGVIRLLGIA